MKTYDELVKLALTNGYVQGHKQYVPPARFSGVENIFPEIKPLTEFGRFDLNWHLDKRGGLVEIMRGSWTDRRDSGDHENVPEFMRQNHYVGQAYISSTLPGVTKAWHLHARQYDRFFCVRGKVLLALYCFEADQVAEMILDSEKQPQTVIIPPGIAHGWKNIGDTESWILNLVSHEYDGTDEFRRAAHIGPSDKKFYSWNAEVDG